VTSEIAILNKAAIAVAADSAVTVGKAKVHRFANKIFCICDAVPIGIMYFGFSEYAGIPWETLIKVFRAENGHKRYSKVDLVWKDFQTFLSHPSLITESASQVSLVYFAADIASRLRKKIIRKAQKATDKDILNFINAEIDIYNQLDDIENAGAGSLKKFSGKYGSTILGIFQTLLSEHGINIQKSAKEIVNKLVHRALRSQHLSSYYTGLVFFGFGSDEIMPALDSYNIDGVPLGKLRYQNYIRTAVDTQENPACIVPFADYEAMIAFMEGSTEQTREFYDALMKEFAIRIADRVITDNFSVDANQRKIIDSFNRDTIEDLMSEFKKMADEWRYRKYIDPLGTNLRGLPKEDMAILAEALVEASALRKKMTVDIESVGGPVDVALVTKGDGFIWIKRKKYFDIDQNLNYAYNRFGSRLGLIIRGDGDVSSYIP
jgi:hypothetical protein